MQQEITDVGCNGSTDDGELGCIREVFLEEVTFSL